MAPGEEEGGARSREPTVDPLAMAVAALGRGDASEAVERLREAWRATRDPGLANVYEVLVREFRAPPLTGDDPVARAESWLACAQKHAGEALVLPVLLAEPWLPLEDEQRLSLLEPWSPDPLLATALARGLLNRREGLEVSRRILALLEEQGDARQLERLDQLPRWFRRKDVERARARLLAIRGQSLTPQQRSHAATLQRRAKLRRDREARTAELLAAVRAAPDLDEPRLVYADWLATEGDPHGEFIVLQVERARTGGPASLREQELLASHGHTWAGTIYPLLDSGSLVFERGFLASASIETFGVGERAEAGEWSTLRILDGHVDDDLVRDGPLDHLRELYGYLQLDRFVTLRADNRLARVETYECSLADPDLPFFVPLGLRTLLVRRALDDVLLSLIGSPAITGLEQLGVYYRPEWTYATDHRERSAIRDRFDLLRGRLPEHVRRLSLFDSNNARASRPCGWTLTFDRDELEVFSQLRVDWQRPALDRKGHEAVTQLVGSLEQLGLGSLRRLSLGRFDDPARSEALERLRELTRNSGCELGPAQ